MNVGGVSRVGVSEWSGVSGVSGVLWVKGRIRPVSATNVNLAASRYTHSHCSGLVQRCALSPGCTAPLTNSVFKKKTFSTPTENITGLWTMWRFSVWPLLALFSLLALGGEWNPSAPFCWNPPALQHADFVSLSLFFSPSACYTHSAATSLHFVTVL